MPSAPWAMLNTRVVEEASTSPEAAMAYAAPETSPKMVKARNELIS